MVPSMYLSIVFGILGSEERLAQATEVANRPALARISWSFSEACTSLPLTFLGSDIGHSLNGHLELYCSNFANVWEQKVTVHMQVLTLFGFFFEEFLVVCPLQVTQSE